MSCVCKTGGQHLPALGVFDPSQGDSAGEWHDLNPGAPDCRILAAQPDAFPPSLRDLADPLRLCYCGVSEAPVCCPLCTSEGHLLPPAFIPPANPRATLGIHVFGRRAQKGVGVPAGSSECSCVEHRVVWLLGTSCCLMVLPEAELAVSELLRTALNSWQEPDAAELPRPPRCWDEAVLPCSPWTDASAGPRGGPLPRLLCSLLFREAQAYVVNLNCFLIRLLPPGTLIASPPAPPGTWPRPGGSWSGRGWMLGQPPKGCQPERGTHVMEPWSQYLSLQGPNGRNQEPRFTAGAGRSLGAHSVTVGMPSFSRVPSSCLNHLGAFLKSAVQGLQQ